jgi:hypothetical protein
VLWWLEPEVRVLEPAANVLVLIAAVAGIPADRWVTAMARRDRALRAVRAELARNREILADDRFEPRGRSAQRRVFPRLVLSAVDTAVISGALGRDAELLSRLIDWRYVVEEVNRRLDLTELRTFTAPATDERELRSFDTALGDYLADVRGQLEAVEAAVAAQLGGVSRWPTFWGPVRRLRRVDS